MSERPKNNRRFPRKLSKKLFRVYTSVTGEATTVHLKDISMGGAFIFSRNPPKVGEVITFAAIENIVSDLKHVSFIGKARVVWIKEDGPADERGFGIEFEKEIKEQIVNEMEIG